jgi:LysM repeat protein
MGLLKSFFKYLEPPKPKPKSKPKPKPKKKKKTKNTNTENKTVTFGVDKIPKSDSQKKLSRLVNKAKKEDKEKIKKAAKTLGVGTVIGGTIYGLSANKKKKAVDQEGGVGQGLPLKAKKTQGRSLGIGGKDVSRKKKVQTKPPVKKSYAIKSGDTLSQIARRRGTTLKALLAANPQIKNPNRIRVGQKINISSPVKNRKSVYQGLSKSQMKKMSVKKKHGGRINYRMTGGQVVAAGYD